MNGPHQHIIERARIDVTSPTGNYTLQRNVANWWSANAVPAIEKVLEDLLPPGVHLRLERLDLDLGHFKRLDPELPGDRDELTARLTEALRHVLTELLADARASTYVAEGTIAAHRRPENGDGKEAKSPEGRRFTAWLHYLEFGHLPWWSEAFPEAADWADFIAASLGGAEPVHRAALVRLVRRSRAAILRLAADERHGVAFATLLERNKKLETAWNTWRAAAETYSEMARRLPDSAPPATEWTTAGKVVCWWFLLAETNFKHQEAALRALLNIAMPELTRWPKEQSRRIQAVLGLPPASSRTSPTKDQPATTGKPYGDQASGIGGHDVITDEQELFSKVDEKTLEEGLPSPEPLSLKKPGEESLADERPSPSGNTGSEEEQQTEKPTASSAELVSGKGTPASDPERIGGAEGDVPKTVAWSEAGLETHTAPASAPEKNTDAWYVDHAGVVLVHPFLAPLFTALGYWSDGAFVDATAQQRAVYLTHYLATGTAETYEEDLPLCKLLCGWPVSGAPARLTVPLTDTDRHEADEVLRSVIEHWSAIGAASPEGLREGFFGREGRLREGENGWQVTVDRRAQDILLGRLAWGISMVRCAWHDLFIKVVW